MTNQLTSSAYIHIPFCKSKCNYCSFVSGVDLGKKTGYIYSLLKEIDYYYQSEPLDTLYIGGGTPSLLNTDELKKIIGKFTFCENPEITIEVNPNDITEEYASALKSLGFNRVSIGIQSFDDKILKAIGRRHSAEEGKHAFNILREIGFDNISIDLIYGLPEQNIKGFEQDLKQGLELGAEHISLYGLKIDEGCYFYNHTPNNLPDDDTQADMYLLANRITSEYGYEHYEVSNYSKKGFNSKHNTNYWRCGEYYGFGLSAHGYVSGVRYSNTGEMKDYLQNPTAHEFGKFLTEKDMLEERIFLGLRLSEGINIEEINREFNIDFDKKYSSVISKYLSSGHLTKTEKGYAFSDSKSSNGFLVSNIILSEFI